MTDAERSGMAHVVFLAGPRRGETDRVEGNEIYLGLDAENRVRAVSDPNDLAGGQLAALHIDADGLRVAAPGRDDVCISGEPADGRQLTRADLLQIGDGGNLVRVRTYPGGRPYKRLDEAVRDCVGCATHGASGTIERAAIMTRGLGYELRTQVSPLSRVLTALVVVGLGIGLGLLWRQNSRLEAQLAAQAARVESLEMSVPKVGEAARYGQKELASLRGELEQTRSRLAELEDRAGARTRVIKTASQSVLFLQGAFGFVEPKSGQVLRVVPGGVPEQTQVRLGGDGDPYEILYTGTGFVASAQGHVVTNRHVAQPWDFDESAQQIIKAGLVPKMERLRGYLPGEPDGFAVRFVVAHETADVALLLCDVDTTPFLELSDAQVPLGTEVIVLGYPLGMQALLARADPAFIQNAVKAGPLDFWQAAERIAAAGYVQPLATVGVVGQSTSTNLVYDADTTHGGSGGPVIGPDGRVVAVNAAIIPGFAGSNLGVPAVYVRELLDQATAQQEGQ